MQRQNAIVEQITEEFMDKVLRVLYILHLNANKGGSYGRNQ